jgi:hypothetical protein
MERWFQAFNPHWGGGEMDGRHHYRRVSGGGIAWEAEAALGATAADRTGGGGASSDRRKEMKVEKAEWAAKAGWARWQGGPVSKMENENGVGLGCERRLGWIQIGPLRKIEKCFSNFCFKEMGFKSKVLIISKPNLNWIQNRIKSNHLFGPLANLEIDLNNQM